MFMELYVYDVFLNVLTADTTFTRWSSRICASTVHARIIRIFFRFPNGSLYCCVMLLDGLQQGEYVIGRGEIERRACAPGAIIGMFFPPLQTLFTKTLTCRAACWTHWFMYTFKANLTG